MSLNNYKLIKQLGEGGNGWVRLMRDPDGQEVAVKICKHKNPGSEFTKIKLERFIIEANTVKKLCLEGQKGIIPIINSMLPCEETKEYLFVMPVAIPLEKKIAGVQDLYQLVRIFRELAQVLVELHSKGYSHRDLKPDNILYYDGQYCLADFGLIDFPDKEDLTRKNEALGNRKTMAPEMRLPKEVNDPRAADVYSFAKTLWMVLSGEEYAFDGQFNYYENNKLQLKYPKQHFVELFKLISDSTFEDPSKRPMMQEFLDRLVDWESIANNTSTSAKSLWGFIEESVIKQFQPSTVMWKDEEKVITIVKQLSLLNFNHTFLPSGGGLDLLDISRPDWIKEKNILLLDFGFGMLQVIKLKRLVWEIPNNDPRFSYFRLECEQLSNVYPNSDDMSEELKLNTDGEYEVYNGDEYDDEIGAYINITHITRWLSGSLLIVQKGSIYNHEINAAYDARHSKLDTDQFREYMEILQSIYVHPLLCSRFRILANIDPSVESNFNALRDIIT